MVKIKKVHARQILDSRGNPTVEAEIELENVNKNLTDSTLVGLAAVPSGASTGEREALELRDGDKSHYLGKGVLKAVNNVNEIIAPEITGMEVENQQEIDKKMIELDGTDNKNKLGANAILGVSLACCRGGAISEKKSLYEYIRKCYNLSSSTTYNLPVPMMNILNGGEHADNNVDLQEFMIIPVKGSKFSEALRVGVEVFHSLKSVLKKKGHNTAVGDEGGFAPDLSSNEEALVVIMEAIEKSGNQPGKDVFIGLDSAASELYKEDKYKLEGEPKDKVKTSEEMVEYYQNLVNKYPIISIEDGLAENDWPGWKLLTEKLGNKIQLVGDDIFVTNTKIFSEGIKQKIANAILIKVNQIGTVTETVDAVNLAGKSNYKAVISHRSGETEDTFIADLSVALNTGQIKTGSASRTDRVCKYNQLIRIEEKLGDKAKFPGKNIYKK